MNVVIAALIHIWKVLVKENVYHVIQAVNHVLLQILKMLVFLVYLISIISHHKNIVMMIALNTISTMMQNISAMPATLAA